MATRKNPQDYYFPDTEAETYKVGIDYEVATIARAYREMSAEDRLWFMKLIEFRAWSKTSS